jgi:hypothetical protein
MVNVRVLFPRRGGYPRRRQLRELKLALILGLISSLLMALGIWALYQRAQV